VGAISEMTHIVNKVLNRVKRMIRSIAGQVMIARSEFEAVGRVEISKQVRLRATDGGTARLGDCVVIDRGAELTVKHGRLEIGPRSYVGQYSVICARDAISIGADCLIAEHVTIRDQNHRFGPGLTTAQAGFITAPVTIGDNVWIGAKVMVTKGVTIGENAVIGANSVVTRDIPANSVAVGIPARVIRTIGETP
jgi:acetyltransferase-like isoleucine patch superfamily enzyme